MFTGIIESLGTIQSISNAGKSLELSVSCPFARELELGESVAVNGTCLTVTQKTENSFNADVTPETFRRTSLYELSAGSKVNLERAMKAGGRFGGHIVSGHVDGKGTVQSFQKEENAVNIKIRVSNELGRYIIEKGSVTLDGISLTVAEVKRNSSETVFSVAVIPHTWENTTLHLKNSGSILNVECDIVGKYIEQFLTYPKIQKDSGENDSDSESEKSLAEFMMNFPSFH